MKIRDHYAVIGVARDASTDEIKRAYRKLARRFHPDVSDDAKAEERFKEVNQAYETLKDPKRRQAYDQRGEEWRNGGGFADREGWSASGAADHGTFSGGSFEDLFDNIFGRGKGARHKSQDNRFRMRGSDEHASAVISLEDSYYGQDRVLTLPTEGGEGRRLKFKVPKGITEGKEIRLAGLGMMGYGGEPAGDLYLRVKFAPHRLFRAEGRDIHMVLPITPWEAALGAKVDVPTLGGAVSLTVKPGAQSGQKMRLAGRGLPGEPAGDQMVEISVKVPLADTDEKRALFERMRELMAFEPRNN